MNRSNHRRSLSLIAATLWILLISALMVSAQAPIKPYIPGTTPGSSNTLSSSHFLPGSSPNIHPPANAMLSPTVLQPFAPPSNTPVSLGHSPYTVSFFTTGGGVDVFGYTHIQSCDGFVTTGPNFRIYYQGDATNADFNIIGKYLPGSGIMILDANGGFVTCDSFDTQVRLSAKSYYNIWVITPTEYTPASISLTITIDL